METEFGGKAEGLARLIAAGARVPRGFACSVTTAAPGEWPAAERERSWPTSPSCSRARWPFAPRRSARTPRSARSPASSRRCSARTTDEALAAAGRCVASGVERPGRRLRGVRGVPVGLVVQRLVPARAAGVCFTVDPLGVDHALVVEAVAGAGDALVSGRIDAERFRVYRNGRAGGRSGGWRRAGRRSRRRTRSSLRRAEADAAPGARGPSPRPRVGDRRRGHAVVAADAPGHCLAAAARAPSGALRARGGRRPDHGLVQLERARDDARPPAPAHLGRLARHRGADGDRAARRRRHAKGALSATWRASTWCRGGSTSTCAGCSACRFWGTSACRIMRLVDARAAETVRRLRELRRAPAPPAHRARRSLASSGVGARGQPRTALDPAQPAGAAPRPARPRARGAGRQGAPAGPGSIRGAARGGDVPLLGPGLPQPPRRAAARDLGDGPLRPGLQGFPVLSEGVRSPDRRHRGADDHGVAGRRAPRRGGRAAARGRSSAREGPAQTLIRLQATEAGRAWLAELRGLPRRVRPPRPQGVRSRRPALERERRP